MRRVKFFIMLIPVLLFVYSCSSDDDTKTKEDAKSVIDKDSSTNNTKNDTKETSIYEPSCEEGNKIVNPNGKLHGEPCEKDEECKYGFCYKAAVTNFQYGICTKWCKCGPNSNCSDDDTDEIKYQCYKTFPSEEEVTSYCLPICYSVEDCKKIASFYNDCKVVHGARKQCIYDPSKAPADSSEYDLFDDIPHDVKDVNEGEQ